MIGYTKAELGNISSKEIVQLLHPDDYKENYENLKRHFEGKYVQMQISFFEI